MALTVSRTKGAKYCHILAKSLHVLALSKHTCAKSRVMWQMRAVPDMHWLLLAHTFKVAIETCQIAEVFLLAA